jgi:hypothetical protein
MVPPMDAILEPAEQARPDHTAVPGPRDSAALRLPARAVLLVAGVPGAGKTTLLARVDTRGSRMLDPEAARDAYQRRLGRLPYRLWRPLVHARHYLSVVLALRAPAGLVVHEPGTRAWMRRLLVLAAARAGRQAHLLLLEVSPQEALAGQRQRRRSLRRPAFERHWRRWRRLRRPGRLAGEGWASVRVIDRTAAGRLRRIEIPPGGAADPPGRPASRGRLSGGGRRSPGPR